AVAPCPEFPKECLYLVDDCLTNPRQKSTGVERTVDEFPEVVRSVDLTSYASRAIDGVQGSGAAGAAGLCPIPVPAPDEAIGLWGVPRRRGRRAAARLDHSSYRHNQQPRASTNHALRPTVRPSKACLRHNMPVPCPSQSSCCVRSRPVSSRWRCILDRGSEVQSPGPGRKRPERSGFLCASAR